VIVPTTVDELFELYERHGANNDGEFVTQTVHALPCAALAKRDGDSTLWRDYSDARRSSKKRRNRRADSFANTS
jgi:hypothetical protein